MSIARNAPIAEVDARKTVAFCVRQTNHALHVCDLIEALADDLPRRVSTHWREVQLQSRSVLEPHFRFLSDVLFPKLLKAMGRAKETEQDSDKDRRAVLTRLQTDCTDQLHALSDLDDLITDALLTDKFTHEPEALGYALRGHFDALRRDLNWQLDVLWPLAGRSWTDSEARAVMLAFPSPKATVTWLRTP